MAPGQKDREGGRPPKKDPVNRPTVVYLTQQERDAVDAAAESQERSRSWWIGKAVQEKLEREGA